LKTILVRTKRWVGIIAVLLFFAVSSVISAQSVEYTRESVVSSVGSRIITAGEFISRYEEFLFQTGAQDKFPGRLSYLNNMINELLLYYYDNNDEIFKDPNYQKELAWKKKQVVLAYLKDQEVYAKMKVSDEEARKTFLRMNQKIAVRHLYAKTKKEADELYQLLQVGVSFDSLAGQTFSDTTLANNGGFLGYVSWGDLDPAFEDAAFSLKIGEISKPVKTSNGYSIIRVDDIVTNPLLTENEYLNQKKQIIRAIKINNKQRAEDKYVNGVVDYKKIKFDSACVKKLYDDFFSSGLNLKEIRNEAASAGNCLTYGKENYSYTVLYNKIHSLPNFQFKKITGVKKFTAVLKGFVLQDKLLEIAREKGYDTLAVVKKKFQKMKMNLFMQFKSIEILRGSAAPDSLVKSYYDEHKDFFTAHDSINVQEIIIPTKELADSLLQRAKRGEDFGKLAAAYSIRKETAINNGVVGFVSSSKFINFEKIFIESRKNDLIGPIEFANSWGLFKILEVKRGYALPFAEVKEDAALMAKHAYQRKFIEAYTNGLKRFADVKINKKLLGSLKVQSLSK